MGALAQTVHTPARSWRASAAALPWPALALAVLAALTLIGFAVYPTYPNYDSYYALLWGRELLHGAPLSFDAYRAPTQHPLAIAFGAALRLYGGAADRIMVGATLVAFLALLAAMYALARACLGRLAGVVAAAILCTRFDLPFLAARAYIDIPYLALVLWAAALEARRPRRGVPVLAILAAAGLMRPDAWVLSGLYTLWLARTWRERFLFAGLTAIGPVVWVLVDWAVTGHPLFSFTHTSGLAEELGRSAGLSEVPAATLRFLNGLDKWPVLALGVLGVGLALWRWPRRVRVPLALLGAGLATFALVTLAGLSVVFRYLLLPSLMIVLFAALPLTGWTLLEPGRMRRRWAAAAGVLVLAGLVFTVSHTTPSRFADELRFRGGYHAGLRSLLEDPRVVAARRCGPVSLPNHKLVPEVRWLLRAPPEKVVARSQRTPRRGVGIYASGRMTLLRYGYSPDGYRRAIPPRRFHLLAANGFFAAWGRC
jgi:hypothetical protein